MEDIPEGPSKLCCFSIHGELKEHCQSVGASCGSVKCREAHANGLNLTYHLVLSVLNVMTVFLPPKPACAVSLKVLFLVLYSQYLCFISP